jgi:hypothetical protein
MPKLALALLSQPFADLPITQQFATSTSHLAVLHKYTTMQTALVNAQLSKLVSVVLPGMPKLALAQLSQLSVV